MAHNTTHNTITNTHSHSHSQRQRSHHTHTTHALPCSLLSASALQQAQSQPVAPCSQHRHMLAYRMAHTFHAALNPADRPCGQHTLPQTEACVLSHLTKRPVNCAHACTAMIKLQCCARDTRAHHVCHAGTLWHTRGYIQGSHAVLCVLTYPNQHLAVVSWH